MDAATRKPKLTVPETLAKEATQGLRASWWRQYRMHMTREALAPLVGYNPDSILNFERDRVARSSTWHRYRRACENAHREKFPTDKKPFDWGM